MSVLLSVRSLGHAFGARPLFQGLSFTLKERDRVGLIGPNGAGKSTLMQILAASLAPDVGEVMRRVGLRVAMVEQMPEFTSGSVRDEVASALSGSTVGEDEKALRVERWLGKLELDGGAGIAELSGGWKKRVALAKVLVTEPDLLLLDEPTNHLDVESILQLERILSSSPFATLTVTHDRLFLQRVSNRILELDRRNLDGLLDVHGDYASYLERKAELLASQERQEQVLKNTLRRETEWLRRGPPARSTKQAARVARAENLKKDVAKLSEHNKSGEVALDFQSTGSRLAQKKRLIEARGITKSYGGQVVFEPLDLLITPKTRLGLLGPNGCGKSTLLRALTGQEPTTGGKVLHAEDLRVAYFEQNRSTLDPRLTPVDTVCPDGDYVLFRGSHLHRHGYLERFLFRPEQMKQPVASLSGGEQSRLLVAQLMLQPANVLVLDEPTNDLDIPTLSVLQEALISFDGAVLLVTHDRYFLDQVSTEILAFNTKPDELGQVTSLVGLAQWEAWYKTQRNSRPAPREKAKQQTSPTKKKKKLSYKDQRDWDSLEARIQANEGQLASLELECAKPEVATDAARLMELHQEMSALSAEIEQSYARWAELEAMQEE